MISLHRASRAKTSSTHPRTLSIVGHLEMLERRQMLASAAGAALSVNHVFVPSSDISRARNPQKAFAYTHYQGYNAADDPIVNPHSTSPVGRLPAQVRKSYGVDTLMFGAVAGDGTGQTIAIVDAFDDPSFVSSTAANYGTSDLVRFDAATGLVDPPSFKKVNQSGVEGSYPAFDGGWAGEIALDVEWAHAMAPKANIILVEATNNGLNNLASAVNTAKNIPGVTAISMSFGANEFAGETSFDSTYLTPAGHAGVSFFSSTGDAGAPGSYQAYSPNVIAVGGTHLNQADSSGTYSSESGWAGSGGGISAQETKPSYQNLVTTPSATQRTNPDVAADADPSTGVAVLDSANNGSASPWNGFLVGGTSLSSPLWAGFSALVNQGRATIGLGSLEGRTQTLPRLYTLNPVDYHDITSGNNGFAAAAGYDLVTGRGSPRQQLYRNLAGGASIAGAIFQDNNGNGTPDVGEPGMSGVQVFLDLNNNGSFDAAFETQATTGAGGTYSFADQVGGVGFVVRTASPAGFVRTTAANLTSTTTFNTTNAGVSFGFFPIAFTGNAFTLKTSGVAEQIYTATSAAGSPAFSAAISLLNASGLTFTGTGGADVLNVDLSGGNVPIPTAGVTYSGTNAADTIAVTGSAGADTVSLNASTVAFAGGLNLNFGAIGIFNIALDGGADTLNFNGAGGAVLLDFGTGTDTLNVLSGTFTASSDLGTGGSSVTVNVSAGATASFASTQHLATLSLPNGANANVQSNGNCVLVISSAANITGTLDLNDNDLLIFGNGLLPAVQNLIDTGRTGGAWTGTGITSTAARNNGFHNTTLGAMTESEFRSINGPAATFDGEALATPAVVVKYTWYGDVDFNGTVDFDDYSRVDAGFNGNKTGWLNGDVDGNGVVDFDDYSLIDMAFNTQIGIL